MSIIRKPKKGARSSDLSSKKKWECMICRADFKTNRGLDDHISAKHPSSQAPKIIRPPACLECGGISILTEGRDLYPHRPDLYSLPFYKCACGAYCGCHSGTKRPLGNPAGPKTRAARRRAHDAFDPIWRDTTKGISRNQAYKLAAEDLNIPPGDCHIGMMNAETADRMTRWAYNWRAKYRGQKI